MPPQSAQIHLIDSESDLESLVDTLGECGSIAVDTEFNRTSTYRPELCLLQMAAGPELAVVDMLAAGAAEPLRRLLCEVRGLKLFHAAKQDLEALYLNFGLLPNRILDTQIAAGLLGYPAQIGYANLVQDLLGIQLDKTQTRTDWSRRPLTPAQLAYAAEDVIHLFALEAHLHERLDTLGRYDWAIEDSNALLDPQLYEVQAEQAWQRLGAVIYLPVPVQGRARALAAWRENAAAQANRPRQWLLTDKALLAMAAADPGSPDELARVEDLPAGVVRRQGKALIDTMAAANEALRSGRLDLRQEQRPERPDLDAVKMLSKVVKKAAEELGIAAEVLATRRELAALARGELEQRVTSGWRRPVIGEALLAAL